MAAADVAANVVGAVTRMLRRLFRFEVAVWGEEMARQGLPPGDIDAALAEETSREAVFARRSAERVAKAVRLALASTDPSARAAAFQAALRREQHYARYRAEAMAGRLFAAVEREALRRLSPTGAFWELSPFVAEHTPDCLAMGNKFWPWEVLDRIHPPLHAGCPCRLRSFGEAVSAGLMNPGDVPTTEQARRLSAGVLSYLEREERAQAAALAELDLRIETVARGMLSPEWGAALPLPVIEAADLLTEAEVLLAADWDEDFLHEASARGFAAKAAGAFGAFDVEWNPELHPRNVFGRFIETIDKLDQKGSGKKHTAYLDPHTRVTKQKDGTFRVVRSGPNREGHYGASGFESAEDAARAAFDASAGAEVEGSIGGNRKLKDFDDFLKGEGIDPDAPTGSEEHLRAEVERLQKLVDEPGPGEAGKIRRRANKRRLENFQRKLKALEAGKKVEPRFGPGGDDEGAPKPEPDKPDRPDDASFTHFHVAPRSAREDILKNGLQPSYDPAYADEFGIEDPVFLWTDRAGAEDWVRDHAGGSDEFDIWEVAPPNKTQYDPNNSSDLHPGAIPPENVRLAKPEGDAPEPDKPEPETPDPDKPDERAPGPEAPDKPDAPNAEGPPEPTFDDAIGEPAREATRKAIAAYHAALPGMMPSKVHVRALSDDEEEGVGGRALHDGSIGIFPDAPNNSSTAFTIVHEMAHAWDREKSAEGESFWTENTEDPDADALTDLLWNSASVEAIKSGDVSIIDQSERGYYSQGKETLARAIERYVADNGGDAEMTSSFETLTAGPIGPVYWKDDSDFDAIAAKLRELSDGGSGEGAPSEPEETPTPESDAPTTPSPPPTAEPTDGPPRIAGRRLAPGEIIRWTGFGTSAGDVEGGGIALDAERHQWRAHPMPDGSYEVERSIEPYTGDPFKLEFGQRVPAESREDVEALLREANRAHIEQVVSAMAGGARPELPLAPGVPLGPGDNLTLPGAIGPRRIVAVDYETGEVYLDAVNTKRFPHISFRPSRVRLEDVYGPTSGAKVALETDAALTAYEEREFTADEVGIGVASDAPAEARAIMEKLNARRLEIVNEGGPLAVSPDSREMVALVRAGKLGEDHEFLTQIGREAMETGLIPPPSVSVFNDETDYDALRAEMDAKYREALKRVEGDVMAGIEARRRFHEERDALVKRQAEARTALARAHAEKVREGFRQFRARFGEGSFEPVSGKATKKLEKRLDEEAVRFFPAEWIDGRGRPDLAAQKSGGGFTDPGYAWSRDSARKGKVAGPWGRIAGDARQVTMIHEMGHYHELFHPGIHRAEADFFDYRTEGDPVVRLTEYGGKPRGKRDKWPRGYSGRIYGPDTAANEVFTTGLEHLFYAEDVRYQRNQPNAGEEVVDPEFQGFIAGILLGL